MENFTPFNAVTGGLLIGVAATIMLWTNGRITGISGILSGILIPNRFDTPWKATFVIGLILGPLSYMLITNRSLEIVTQTTPLLSIVGGLIVGFGTRLGSGCTSGHGVCGIARFSSRSFLATSIFMGTAIATVFITRHLFGTNVQ
jgi:uncharacterized membrane protein YedE/YeeE